MVKLANDPNVGVVFDTFNLLAVEYAAPYNPKGHGRIYDTEEESLAVIRESLKELAATVDPSKILVVQVADAERIDPGIFKLPEDPTIPPILPWSRGHRLFPCEPERGGYLPVGEALAAILATVGSIKKIPVGTDVTDTPTHASPGIQRPLDHRSLQQ